MSKNHHSIEFLYFALLNYAINNKYDSYSRGYQCRLTRMNTNVPPIADKSGGINICFSCVPNVINMFYVAVQTENEQTQTNENVFDF